MYKELNIYSNSTVSTKCCQFSLLENIFENNTSAGIEISSVKRTLLIVNLLKLFKFIFYFHPARSNILTAFALFSPKVLIEMLSSLKVPHEETILDEGTPATTGYSKLPEANKF